MKQMKNIPFGIPSLGKEEEEVLIETLRSGMLVHGPKAKEFERDFAKFTNAPFAVSVSSCTAGLHLAYFYLGIGVGDEVIVPAQTHTATAHAVELTGAKVVFVDCESKTGNIDIDQIEEKINERTKALSIVHFLGMPVDMERVMFLAQKHNLFVVEDCALAVGSYFKGVHAGLYGDVGVFSFYPVKHFTTAEGGMVITKNAIIAQKLERQKAFGVDRTAVERIIPGVYDVTMLGFNYRMNELEAAIGIEQLKKVPNFLNIRKKNYDYMQKKLMLFEELELLESSKVNFQSSYYCLSILLKEPLDNKRFEFVSLLKEKGIGTSVYYPKPVPHMSYYKNKYNYNNMDFPNALKISNNSVALPVGPHISIEDADYIVESIKETIKEIRK